MLTLVYVALAVLGCGYVVFASLFGMFSDGGDAVHDAAGGADVAYGVEAGGHGSAAADAASAAVFHFPLFSPLALATFFGALGGYGLIAKAGLDVSDGMSLAIAVPASLVTAYLVTFGSWKLVNASRGSSQIRPGDLVGAIGEVITPIPAGGMGEVAAMVGGQRFTSPARSIDGAAVPRGAVVEVRQLAGGTLLVAPRQAAGATER